MRRVQLRPHDANNLLRLGALLHNIPKSGVASARFGSPDGNPARKWNDLGPAVNCYGRAVELITTGADQAEGSETGAAREEDASERKSTQLRGVFGKMALALKGLDRTGSQLHAHTEERCRSLMTTVAPAVHGKKAARCY
jgi:hypothetical protein